MNENDKISTKPNKQKLFRRIAAACIICAIAANALMLCVWLDERDKYSHGWRDFYNYGELPEQGIPYGGEGYYYKPYFTVRIPAKPYFADETADEMFDILISEPNTESYFLHRETTLVVIASVGTLFWLSGLALYAAVKRKA
ncbi:MAG: hypothetical protein LBQ91_02790 [Oscillospiraceae bacterium]|nr:hypothetical protein [Oscillospiraceae bacterium]